MTMNVDIIGCARCQINHEKLEFKHFHGQPIADTDGCGRLVFFDWWAICPVTGDPILMRSDDADFLMAADPHLKDND